MWFTFAILLYTTILVVNAALSGTVEEHYPWTGLFGEFGFLLDGLASPFAIIIYVLSTILVLYSKPYMIHKFHEQYEEEKALNSSGNGQSSVVESSSLNELCKCKIWTLLCTLSCLCNGNAWNCSCNQSDRILYFL